MGGFAPVTDDGYGMGYGISNDFIGMTKNINFWKLLSFMLGCNVTTYPARDGQQLINNLECVLNDLHDVIKTM